MDWRLRALQIAVYGWIAGFYWCEGRWEHERWLQFIVFPAFALNGDRMWSLWQEWFRERPLAVVLLFTLFELQFWLAGWRANEWWGGAGSGRDFVTLAVLLSSLVVLQPKGKLRQVIFLVGALAVAVSLLFFYSQYGFSEERFRLSWRYAKGFNAVTTGLLVGFALVCGLPRQSKTPLWRLLLLALLAFALAASESRGALLATSAAILFWVIQVKQLRPVVFAFSAIVSGFLFYWLLVAVGDEESGALVARGSAGRWEIYQTYLAKMTAGDWFFGKGELPMLPPAELGWLVHHTHNGYLGQVVAFGLPSLLLFGAIVAFVIRGNAKSRFLPLLAFGLVALLFDGGLPMSAFSLARWECLVVALPLFCLVSEGREKANYLRQRANSEG